MIKQCALVLTLVGSQAAVAGDYYSLSDDWEQQESTPLIVASDDNGWMKQAVDNHKAEPTEFKEHTITANKIHKYLGIGSLGSAVLAGISPKEEDGAHEMFGRTAAALGVAAVVTGLTFHWDDIHLSNGLSDPVNLHMGLTTLGTLGFLSAVSTAPDSHAGPGIGGALSMAVGIKMVW